MIYSAITNLLIETTGLMKNAGPKSAKERRRLFDRPVNGAVGALTVCLITGRSSSAAV